MHTALFTKGLAVSTLAESMFLDAWKYHSEKQMASGAEANTAFFNNTAIRRICEVRKSVAVNLVLGCLMMLCLSFRKHNQRLKQQSKSFQVNHLQLYPEHLPHKVYKVYPQTQSLYFCIHHRVFFTVNVFTFNHTS